MLLIATTFLMISMMASCHLLKKDAGIDHLIFITLDTTRADRLGCYGYTKAKTPHLDQLAQHAVIFENAICHSPTTVPSHATMMTGLYPPRHGVRVTGSHLCPSELKTLAEILKEHQFQTAAVVSAYPVTRRFGLDQGFDYYEDSFLDELHKPPVLERKAEKSIRIALDWLKKNKDSGLFLWLHLWDPHAEYDPPAPFDKQFAEDLYDGEVAYMDWCLGSFFEKLKEWDIYHSSLIIIAGDHGEGLGDHGEFEHQYFLYDTTIKVPFIVKTAGQNAAMRVREEVGLVDIFPTLLDLLGIPWQHSIDGESLKPLIDGNASKMTDRPFYLEALSGQISMGWSPMYAIRKEGWKFIEAPVPELYNLKEDPLERNDLSSTGIQKEEDLREELGNLMEDLEKTERMPVESMDDDAMRNLASLGYVSSGALSRVRPDSDKDPKKYIKIEKDINILLRLFSEKKSEEVFPYINRILEIDPENRLALHYAGAAYYEQGKYEKAIPHLEKLMTLYPDHDAGGEYLIRIYSSMRSWEKALEMCDKSIEFYPDEPKFHIYKGLVLANTDRCMEALGSFEAAIRLDENLPDVYYYMARCSAITGQEERALEYIEISLKKRIRNPKAYLMDSAFTNMKNFSKVKELLSSFAIK
jgi:arylsulfatase A-like enzyme